MLFTGKGDDGTTTAYGGKKRFSKASKLTEALGSVDELNSLLGVCRAKLGSSELAVGSLKFKDILLEVQQNLFIIQAELAGADKKISEEKVKKAEKIIGEIEGKLPPIKSFLVPGATEISALFDFARTVARRAERRVVVTAKESKISKNTLAYLNRLSSLLYALARLAARRAGKKEKKPCYR